MTSAELARDLAILFYGQQNAEWVDTPSGQRKLALAEAMLGGWRVEVRRELLGEMIDFCTRGKATEAAGGRK